MFAKLEEINSRPGPFEFYTAEDLWTDAHTSGRMLALHLDGSVDAASRSAAFIDRSVQWMVSRFGVTAGTRVLDLGCGPGLYASRLARAGAEVTGVDFSERSIAHARESAEESGLSVRYLRRNYLEYEPGGRFDLVLMIMCDYCALGPAQRRRMLDTFRAALAPGGSVVLDVYSPAAFAAREETAAYAENLLGGFWSAEKYYGFLNTFKYGREMVVLDKYTIVEASRTRTVYNWFQHFTPEMLEREFRAAGLRVAELFGDVAGAPFDPEAEVFAVAAQGK